ncbi:protein TORNADO 1 [Dioscorea cayenensis subsp. rotundata]|uniref:Protein TORNADO 1 n=1 Tax=Dioscorea cayennensis subsp. rotundata TaxID=55577 RepID=A0AB40BU43_DIOCR|nr:protein TORNADO 1 [Dioscorea cayenensis subsp. rotundata]
MSSQKTRDLQWTLQAIRSGKTNLQNISFFHTQSTSGSFQESDNSSSISFSANNDDDNDGINYFNQLLAVLAAAARETNHTTPMNLSFHSVDWKPGPLQNLRCLLLGKNNSNIRQLEFQRNMFGASGLSELSEMIGRNNILEVVIFSECQIGFLGAKLLASALTKNETLEELQVWEDSISSKGAEELSRMIEVNSTLKLLTVVDNNSITATPLISAVLARNRAMEVHIWSRSNNGNRSSKVVEFTPETNTLRVYDVDHSGSQRIACALGLNATVRTLDMTGIRLKSKWAREFRCVLEQNRTLKEVVLSRTCLKDKAIVYIAAGFFKNRFLSKLHLDGNWFTGIGVEHLLCPLSRFSPFQTQANTTLTWLSFGGVKTKIGRGGVIAILKMLETNQTVTHFSIYNDTSLKPEDAVKIFRSLERNATLRCLSFRCCRGIQGEMVLQSVMDTLQVNPWIEEIDLTGTPLHDAGKADRIYEKLGQNSSLVPEKDLLNDLQLTTPTFCRVFFCGQEFAGKNSLCNSILHNLDSSRLTYTDALRTLVNPVEQIVRSSDIKIKTSQDGDIKISIWNLAGQHENFALHDLMFPGHGSPSFFLIVSSMFRKPANREPKTPEEVEADLLYWLRFIVSNSRRADTRSKLPHITIVLTHYDKVSQQQSGHLQTIASSVQRLRERFQDSTDFYPTVFTVDARSSVSVSKLTHHLRMTSRTVVQKAPQVYQLCNDLIKLIAEWRSQNFNRPVMRWSQFCELCQLNIPALRIRSRRDNMGSVDMRRRAVATSLQHVGEVIFFEELGFLILDCGWFCGEVLGQLAKLNATKNSTTEGNGFISKKELEKILRGRLQNQIPGMGSKVFDNLEAGDLIKMMLQLELCYEQDPGNPNTMLLIPGLLEEGRGKSQKWQLNTPECVYVGRRLEFDNSRQMFLTAGFFPRLQVHLHNKIFRLKNQQGAIYSLEKNLILIEINGIHVRVELGEQLSYYYIDILGCSAKTQNINEMLRLFHQLIIPTIHSLCPGITVTESILRPDCVKYLLPSSLRRTQCVPLQRLKQALLSMPADSMYDYQHTWVSLMDGTRTILRSGFDYARNLLSDEDFREVLHRRYYDLHHLAREVAVPLAPSENQEAPTAAADHMVEPSLSGIAQGVETILQRLKIIEQGIKDLKQEIQGLRYYEHRLVIELHRKLDYLVNYNIQLEERKVPQFFYFVQVQNYTKRLVTKLFSGMTALRLHMLCEYRREMHVVDDQMGCELMQVDNQALKCLLPYMSKFMKLLTFALKIGVHLAAGMGEMIPDLSREVAHLIDSSFLYGTAAIAAGAVGGAAALGRARGTQSRGSLNPESSINSRNISQDIKAAQQWLVDFLKDQKIATGKDIAQRFGLWRVRYTDTGHIAWICRRHKEARGIQVVEVPI